MRHNVVLSPSQLRAEKTFSDFLQDDSQSEMVISGFAGSGKSFLTKYLSRAASNVFKMQKSMDKSYKRPKVYFTATTNKAAYVLQNMVGNPASTVHGLLGLQPKPDYVNGGYKLETTFRTVPRENALLFLDEASMIDSELLYYVREYFIRQGGSKVVYIGDQYQLASVKEKVSPVFREISNIVHLKEIQRQVASSPIIQTANLFREILDSGIPEAWPVAITNNASVYHVTGPEMMKLIDDRYIHQHNPDNLKMLAYTNNRVRNMNSYIQRLTRGTDNLVPGDTVVANAPIINDRGDVVVQTDHMMVVKEIYPTTSDLGYSGFKVKLKNGLEVFMPGNWDTVNNDIKHFKKHSDWKMCHLIKNSCADLRPIHAATCHKAQGSTYGEVFIDLTDIGRNKRWDEVARLMYVAISRAQKAVYLYGDLPIRRWTK